MRQECEYCGKHTVSPKRIANGRLLRNGQYKGWVCSPSCKADLHAWEQERQGKPSCYEGNYREYSLPDMGF